MIVRRKQDAWDIVKRMFPAIEYDLDRTKFFGYCCYFDSIRQVQVIDKDDFFSIVERTEEDSPYVWSIFIELPSDEDLDDLRYKKVDIDLFESVLAEIKEGQAKTKDDLDYLLGKISLLFRLHLIDSDEYDSLYKEKTAYYENIELITGEAP